MRDEFDELLELEKKNRDSKDVKKKMNIYFYKRLSVFAVVFTLILGCLYVINPFKQKEDVITYYNPAKLSIEGLDNKTSLGLILSSFYRTQYSGVELSLHEISHEKEQYVLRVQEISDLNSISYGDKDELSEIVFDKNSIIFQHTFSIWLDEYGKKNDSYHLSRELNELKDLPDSSILEVALTFEDSLSAEELIDLMKEYKDVQFVWGCIGNQHQMAYGINLKNMLIYDVNKEFENKYPCLNEFDQYDSKELQQHYLSSLKLLMDYPEVLKGINESTKSLEEKYNEVKEGLSFIGVKCYIKKKDLINGINNNDFQYGMIEDIRYSKYER